MCCTTLLGDIIFWNDPITSLNDISRKDGEVQFMGSLLLVRVIAIRVVQHNLRAVTLLYREIARQLGFAYTYPCSCMSFGFQELSSKSICLDALEHVGLNPSSLSRKKASHSFLWLTSLLTSLKLDYINAWMWVSHCEDLNYHDCNMCTWICTYACCTINIIIIHKNLNKWV